MSLWFQSPVPTGDKHKPSTVPPVKPSQCGEGGGGHTYTEEEEEEEEDEDKGAGSRAI